MNRQETGPRWALDTPIPIQWVTVAAYAMVVVVFLGDWFTPTSVVVDIAYQAPVAFAAFKGTPRLTTLTVVLGVFGISLGWLMDLAQASFHFSDVRIENRILAIVSLLIVGSLAVFIQRNAQRATQLDGQRALRRENLFATVVERVVSALSSGTTIEAITAEAPKFLGSAAAVWCSTQRDGRFLSAADGDTTAKPLFVHPSVTFENLVRRVGSQRSVEVVDAGESIDFLIGTPVGSQKALAIPLGHATTNFGVLFVSLRSPHVDDATLAAAENLARFASTAMSQAEGVALLSTRSDGATPHSLGAQRLA